MDYEKQNYRIKEKNKREREKERKDMNKQIPIDITFICLKIGHGQKKIDRNTGPKVRIRREDTVRIEHTVTFNEFLARSN